MLIDRLIILFIDLNESYQLQICFGKTARATLQNPVFHFSFEFLQRFGLFYLSRQNFRDFWTKVAQALYAFAN